MIRDPLRVFCNCEPLVLKDKGPSLIILVMLSQFLKLRLNEQQFNVGPLGGYYEPDKTIQQPFEEQKNKSVPQLNQALSDSSAGVGNYFA